MTNNYILAISGNDIFSGGGLYADLATYTTNKLHGFLAVTCLTALTEKGFDVFATDETVFSHQLNSLKDVPFSGIKLGLLPNVTIADLALDFVKTHQEIPIVLDPVLVCKEKHDVEVSVVEILPLRDHYHTKLGRSGAIDPKINQNLGRYEGSCQTIEPVRRKICGG